MGVMWPGAVVLRLHGVLTVAGGCAGLLLRGGCYRALMGPPISAVLCVGVGLRCAGFDRACVCVCVCVRVRGSGGLGLGFWGPGGLRFWGSGSGGLRLGVWGSGGLGAGGSGGLGVWGGGSGPLGFPGSGGLGLRIWPSGGWGVCGGGLGRGVSVVFGGRFAAACALWGWGDWTGPFWSKGVGLERDSRSGVGARCR